MVREDVQPLQDEIRERAQCCRQGTSGASKVWVWRSPRLKWRTMGMTEMRKVMVGFDAASKTTTAHVKIWHNGEVISGCGLQRRDGEVQEPAFHHVVRERSGHDPSSRATRAKKKGQYGSCWPSQLRAPSRASGPSTRAPLWLRVILPVQQRPKQHSSALAEGCVAYPSFASLSVTLLTLFST